MKKLNQLKQFLNASIAFQPDNYFDNYTTTNDIKNDLSQIYPFWTRLFKSFNLVTKDNLTYFRNRNKPITNQDVINLVKRSDLK